jgi:transcriptional regulator with XRE-family HTH domain
LSSFEDTVTLSSFEDRGHDVYERRQWLEGDPVRDITIGDWSKFGATIKAERTRLALSQQELAGRAGVSRSWLAKLEAGHRGAEFEQILRLLGALDLSLVLRSDTSALSEDEASASPARRASLDTKAMQELMDKHQRTAEIRRRAWSAGEPRSRPSDHG